jgi:two-component system chemotaxis sensor kinase CheA
MLVAEGVITQNTLHEAIASQKGDRKGQMLGTILVEQNKVKPAKIVEALQKQAPEEGRGAVHVKDTIRVDYERLENLNNTLGEMVLAESMISQDETILANPSEGLGKKVYNLRQVTRKLQELGTSIRMVPVAGTFQKMARLVRDLSKKSGKNITFTSKGDETELDRAFVDKIADPLVHMIRNAVDHGIETPKEREATGKPPVAQIELRAFHEGGNIHIEIQDDGRGLNREAIVAKAVEKGLITADERLSESEIFGLIFLPGFSTAKQVTEVSGRGVGMDVVKRNIEELRGYVQIQSDFGKGTRFKIILPLTLALIDGMVVKLGAERYIIPVLSVVESLRPPPGIVSTIVGRGEIVSLRNRQLPLFRMAKIFGLAGAQEDPTKALVVVVEHEGRQAGLLVDDLIGMQQTVIKSLGAGLPQSAGFSGGAIMADGRIGLIVDVPGVLKLARNEVASRRV